MALKVMNVPTKMAEHPKSLNVPRKNALTLFVTATSKVPHSVQRVAFAQVKFKFNGFVEDHKLSKIIINILNIH